MSRLERATSLAHTSRLGGIAAVLLLVLLSGCEEDLVPVENIDRPFTLYGFFNPRADTQAIRLYPIEPLLSPTRPEPADAQMEVEDLTGGGAFMLRDSVVEFTPGRFGHVYYAPKKAEYGHTYRLTVHRSDGATSIAETTVPPATLVVQEAAERNPINDWILPIRYRGAPRLINVRVFFTVETFRLGQQNSFIFRTSAYDDTLVPVEDGWLVPVNLTREMQAIRVQFLALGGSMAGVTLVLRDLEMQVLVASEDWLPPGGLFDAEVLVEPGTFSNVENGFGFVSAGYPDTLNWMPDPEVLEAVGFTLRDE